MPCTVVLLCTTIWASGTAGSPEVLALAICAAADDMADAFAVRTDTKTAVEGSETTLFRYHVNVLIAYKLLQFTKLLWALTRVNPTHPVRLTQRQAYYAHARVTTLVLHDMTLATCYECSCIRVSRLLTMNPAKSTKLFHSPSAPSRIKTDT